jgi:hypothetical protein
MTSDVLPHLGRSSDRAQTWYPNGWDNDVKPPLLIALGVAALMIGGYALVTVWDPRDENGSSDVADAVDEKPPYAREPDREPDRERPARGVRASSQRQAPPAAFDEPSEPERPEAVEAAGSPPPDISLEEARSGFSEVMADIDRAIEAGEPLSQREWVELYRRGAEALDPLLRHLDPADPQMGEELGRYQAQLRDKLRQLEPGQTTRLPDPP